VKSSVIAFLLRKFSYRLHLCRMRSCGLRREKLSDDRSLTRVPPLGLGNAVRPPPSDLFYFNRPQYVWFCARRGVAPEQMKSITKYGGHLPRDYRHPGLLEYLSLGPTVCAFIASNTPTRQGKLAAPVPHQQCTGVALY
jgi:hypothetical protein